MYQLTEWARQYYYLMKPGIVFSNALTATAGFLFAMSQQPAQWQTGVGVVVGTAMIIASACVINNIIDRDVDRRMKRTQKRALVTGKISPLHAAIYGAAIGVIGFSLLVWLTNPVAVLIGAIAYIWYVVIYGYAKRKSEHGTLVGTVPGALPPVAGYVAVTGAVDLAAVFLFFMLVFWQMAHFYSIAIYRKDEYMRAGIPILTVVRGVRPAVIQIIVYAFGFMIVTLLPTIFGYTGAAYAIVMFAAGGLWFMESLRLLPLKARALDRAARRLFGVSLIVNIVMCLAIAAGGYLP